MVRPKSSRKRNKHDYASLSRGIISSAAALKVEDEYSDPSCIDESAPHSPDLGVSEKPKTSDALDVEISQLEAIKHTLAVAKSNRERAKRRDSLVRDIEGLRIDEQHSVPPAAPNPFARLNKFTTLPGTTSIQPPLPVSSPKVQDDVSLRELRNITRLNNDAEAYLARYGVGYEGQQQQFSSQPYQPNGKANNNNSVVPKNSVSGKDSRARDCVVYPVVWPQTKLSYSYTATDLPYQKLDLALLGAGEISVILASNPVEQVGRLKLLRRVLYHAKDYTWVACRNFHEAILLEIERGERTWQSTDYIDLEAGILYRHPLPAPTPSRSNNYSQARSNNRRFFCIDYNRNTCEHAGTHDATVGTQVQRVEHFCATCWKRERVSREHKETASVCPHRIN